MRNVVFVAPFPIETTMRFARALGGLDDVRLIGVVHEPPGAEAPYDHLVRVADALDERELSEALEAIVARYGPVHRLTAILEPLQEPLARLRDRFGIEGVGAHTASLFRDKAAMKDALRDAGLGCARHALASSLDEALAFTHEVRFPVVVKPPAGMAGKATWRIEGESQLRRALSALAPSDGDPVLVEEFLRGEEHSFDAITIGGKVRASAVVRYQPSCLEVIENDWIQWTTVMPREPASAAVRELGRRAIEVLGLRTGMTHMEWFRRPDGSLAIGEIAARPPGAHFVRMLGFAHDTSFYRAWARAVVDEVFDGPMERRYAVGCAYLRGFGRGRVVSVEGVDAVQQRVGDLVVEASLPKLGAPKSHGYEGDGHAIVRHPDTSAVEDALSFIVDTIRVRYG